MLRKFTIRSAGCLQRSWPGKSTQCGGEKFFLMTEETGASAFVNFHPAVWCPWQHVPLTVQFHPTNCINCRWTRCSIEFIFLSPMPGPRMASTFPRGSGSVTGKTRNTIRSLHSPYFVHTDQVWVLRWSEWICLVCRDVGKGGRPAAP